MEIDGRTREDRVQDCQVFTQTLDCVGPRRSERLAFRVVSAQSESEAEVAVRRGLCGLRERGNDQRMARVDRHDGGTHPRPGTAAPIRPAKAMAS
jgi:hypothetical protein